MGGHERMDQRGTGGRTQHLAHGGRPKRFGKRLGRDERGGVPEQRPRDKLEQRGPDRPVRVQADPRSTAAGTAYAITFGAPNQDSVATQLFKAVDGGASWSEVDAGLPQMASAPISCNREITFLH